MMKFNSTFTQPIKSFLFILLAIYMSGCATFLVPEKQNITINTGNKKAKVYVSNEQIGEGKSITTKIKKEGVKQAVVQTPGYKDAYYVLLPVKTAPSYAPLTLLSFCFFIYPGLADLSNTSHKMYNYAATVDMPPSNELIHKTNDQKYIRLDAIKLIVENKTKDVKDFYGIKYSTTNQLAEMEKAEKEQLETERKKEEKDLKKKKKQKNLLTDEDNKINFDNTMFSEMIYKTLKKTGYVDTVNKIFADNNNTLLLEGVINKLSVFHINGVPGYSFEKTKVNITWYIKNSFDEIIDSVNQWSYSGDFSFGWQEKNKDSKLEKMFADAVDFSYFNLLKNKTFLKNLQVDTNFSIKDPILSINSSSKNVQDVSEATSSTVTIKRKDGGHGSGFAVSRDGYIITNYHVIAGDRVNKLAELTVILSEGDEIPVTVVRYNRMRDLALLKVDKSFEKCFNLSSNKSFKKLMEVYTVGTPKSIELGQSVSLGIISNERKSNNNHLLQLSMSINPGNSGGPLFEKNGNLQGIVTSKLVGFATEGVGFAIPAYLIPTYLNLKIK
ncbi:MAG: trypsin-like peptidase domain-containing protein [Bacteroidota bacterium]